MEQDRLRNRLANLEDSRSAVGARLKSALGIAPDQASPKFALKLDPEAASFTEQSLLETAFARNPRLKEMRAEVLRAVALYHLAEKATVPDYSFGIGVGVPLAVTPSFGATLPIWRDKIAAEIASGSSALQAAHARLTAEELDLAVRFAETAYAWREANRSADLHGSRLLPKAKAALEAARAGYVTGTSTFADLLDAERELLEHHVLHAEALGQREMVLAEMSLVILGRWPTGVPGVLDQ
jgi:outer membrane protein TolC